MRFRSRLKQWFHGSCPGFSGSFQYFGTRIYFPKNCELFAAACQQVVYERDNVKWLCRLACDGTVIDVGANIGLMAAPVLQRCANSRVISFEPSPTTFQYLVRTVAGSPYAARWQAVGKALCETEGTVDFFESAPAKGAYNGLAETLRGGPSQRVSVPASKIDVEWIGLGRPHISVIKIDVEGAELRVLQGAVECIASQHPPIMLEWSGKNLTAHGMSPEAILDFSNEHGYRLHSMPSLSTIVTAGDLALHMKASESFLLWPERSKANGE